MTQEYYLTSDRNRNIIVTTTNLDELRMVRDKLNKLDKDYLKKSKRSLHAVNFTIERTINEEEETKDN
ncbi:MAG: hypothetical protein CML36_04135 [Rhodobacteraceae bacterium]|nr:hypothetical protein [Paracoccaceae bacterium]